MFNKDTWLATSLVTHNWELFVFGPLLAMLSTPRPVGQKQETLTHRTNYPPTQTHVRVKVKMLNSLDTSFGKFFPLTVKHSSYT